MGGQIEFGRLGGLYAGNVWNHVLNQKPALLLHFKGADEAVATSDSGGTGHTINFNGTAQLDTDQSKFFGSSLLLDGNSDYLDIDDHADWDIVGSNTDKQTIDLWAKHADHVGTEIYIGQTEDAWPATDYWWLYHSHGVGLVFWIQSGGDNILQVSGGEIADTNWHHVALCKIADEYGLYLDGTQTGYKQDASTDTFARSLAIGAHNVSTPGNFFQGHLDEIRIVKANVFGAAPVVGLTDKINVPGIPYTSWR